MVPKILPLIKKSVRLSNFQTLSVRLPSVFRPTFVRLPSDSDYLNVSENVGLSVRYSSGCPTVRSDVTFGVGHQFIISLHLLKSKVLTNIKEVCTKIKVTSRA